MAQWIDSRYEIINKLKDGGTSSVYSAIDRKDADTPLVALKVLSVLPQYDKHISQEFFEREVKALLSLSHPNIVRLLDYGEDPATSRLYLALEYIDRAGTVSVIRNRSTRQVKFVRVFVDLPTLCGSGKSTKTLGWPIDNKLSMLRR